MPAPAVAPAAVGRHQLAHPRAAGAVEDRVPDRHRHALALRPPVHAHLHVGLGEERVDQEAVADRHAFERAEVGHHHVAVEARAAQGGLAELGVLGPQPLHARAHLGQVQDLGQRPGLQRLEQQLEVLLVGPQAGARVERQAQQDVALRVEHVVEVELGGVQAVGLGQQGLEALQVGAGRLVVLVDHAGRAGGQAVAALEALGRLLVAVGQQVVVEPLAAARVVGQVGQDVLGPDLDPLVRDVLRVSGLAQRRSEIAVPVADVDRPTALQPRQNGWCIGAEVRHLGERLRIAEPAAPAVLDAFADHGHTRRQNRQRLITIHSPPDINQSNRSVGLAMVPREQGHDLGAPWHGAREHDHVGAKSRVAVVGPGCVPSGWIVNRSCSDVTLRSLYSQRL